MPQYPHKWHANDIYIFIGFGRSTPRVSLVNHARYMEELIKSLPMDRPIVVSPSMSGDYLLPYLLDGKMAAFSY